MVMVVLVVGMEKQNWLWTEQAFSRAKDKWRGVTIGVCR